MSIHQALWVGYNGEPTDTFVSYLYPIILAEAVDIVHAMSSVQEYTWPPGNVDISHALTSGTLILQLDTYLNWPIEGVDLGHALTAGTLVNVLLFYTNWPIENVDITVHSLTGGTLATVLFFYLNWPTENVDIATHALTGGTLS